MFLRAVKQGLIRSIRLKELVLFFLVLNLAVSMLSITPYWNSFREFFSNRSATQILSHLNISTYYDEFYYYMNPAVESSLQFINLGFIIYFLFTVIFAGGVLFFLWSGDSVKWRVFFQKSLIFLWSMIKILTMTLLLLAGTLTAVVLLSLLLSYLLPTPFVENIYFIFYFCCFIVLTLFVLFVLMLSDLWKILIVSANFSSVLATLRYTITMGWKIWRQIILLYYALFLLSVLLTVLFWLVQHMIPDTNVWGILSGFILLQFFIFLQYWVKFARYGSMMALLNMSKNGQ
jgi:hypothetical protein